MLMKGLCLSIFMCQSDDKIFLFSSFFFVFIICLPFHFIVYVYIYIFVTWATVWFKICPMILMMIQYAYISISIKWFVTSHFNLLTHYVFVFICLFLFCFIFFVFVQRCQLTNRHECGFIHCCCAYEFVMHQHFI